MSCGISPAFAGLSPFEGQVTHVLRTRAPCAGLLYCYRRLRTRLACVKHAASVRSEPGSNSRLKPEVSTVAATLRSERTVKSLGFFSYFKQVQSKTSQSSFVSVHPKQETNQTGSGLYHPIVKEQVLPGQLEGVADEPRYYRRITGMSRKNPMRPINYFDSSISLKMFIFCSIFARSMRQETGNFHWTSSAKSGIRKMQFSNESGATLNMLSRSPFSDIFRVARVDV